MLARRFTIVCLLVTLFGMMFAALVAQAERREPYWSVGTTMGCGSEDGSTCILRAAR